MESRDRPISNKLSSTCSKKKKINYGTNRKIKIIIRKRCYIDRIPNEIVDIILGYIPITMLFTYTRVCKRWYEIIDIKRNRWTKSSDFLNYIKITFSKIIYKECYFNHCTIQRDDVKFVKCHINNCGLVGDDFDIRKCNINNSQLIKQKL